MLQSPLDRKLMGPLGNIAAARDAATFGRSLNRLDWALVSRACAGVKDPERPAHLVGRKCLHAAAQWHLMELAAARTGNPAPAKERATLAKFAYHARWLQYILSGDDARFAPKVSVVIPVYNRARLIGEAVESCLGQSYQPIEIVVVDDGSTDALARALRPYTKKIRLVRKKNGGVSSARNAGIRAARGEFVHFLDSDNLLDPRSIELKVQAFRAIADAGVCYCLSLIYDPHGLGGPGVGELADPDGGPLCATSNLHYVEYPAFISAMMLPRWVTLDAPPFAEWMPHFEDTYYWFCLANRGTKAIALRRTLLERRRVADSISLKLKAAERIGHIGSGLMLSDLLDAPSQWPAIFNVVMRLTMWRRWERLLSDEGTRACECRAQLRRQIEALVRIGPPGRHSPMPMLILFLAGLHWLDSQGHVPAGDSGTFHHALCEAAARALAAAPAMTAEDTRLWLKFRPSRHDFGRAFALLREKLSSEPDSPSRRHCIEFLEQWWAEAAGRFLAPTPTHNRSWLRPFLVGRHKASLPEKLTPIRQILDSWGWGRMEALRQDKDLWRELGAIAEGAAASTPPIAEWLIARPCPIPASIWHLDRLKEAMNSGAPTPKQSTSALNRVHYHARWLAYAAAPEEKALWPAVTIIIPAYDRAWIIKEALDSCLAQTYQPVAIVVVDDGSSDNLEQVLAPYGERVACYRQSHRGVSAARNRGMTIGRSAMVYFLDSDDVIDKDCIAHHMAAYSAVPDLGFSYCGYDRLDQRFSQVKAEPLPAPWARSPEIDPTVDFALAAARGFVPQTGTIMMPRPVAVEAGSFDEWMSVAEDQRFWFKVALNGHKAGRIEKTLASRRIMPDSIWATYGRDSANVATIALLNLTDVLLRPPWWPLVFWLLRRFGEGGRWEKVDSSHEKYLDRARNHLLAVIADLGANFRGGYSPAIAIALALAGLSHLARTKPELARPRQGFHRNLEAAFLDAARSASAITSADVALAGEIASMNRGPALLLPALRSASRLVPKNRQAQALRDAFSCLTSAVADAARDSVKVRADSAAPLKTRSGQRRREVPATDEV